MAYTTADSRKYRMTQFFNRCGKGFVDYLKRSDKLLWLVMLTISAFSLTLLYTVPSNAMGRNYFDIQLIAIVAGYVGAIILTLIDYRTIARYWIWIAAIGAAMILYTLLFGESVTGSDGVNAKAWLQVARWHYLSNIGIGKDPLYDYVWKTSFYFKRKRADSKIPPRLLIGTARCGSNSSRSLAG